MRTHLLRMAVIAALAMAIPAFASATGNTCSIDGTVTASRNTDPVWPAWKYTMVINYDTGNRYQLSHLDVLLDIAGGTCSCENFYDALVLPAVIGQSGTACKMYYTPELNCQGDPSIPNVNGIALKLNPTGTSCDPGTNGTATFVFYSRLSPGVIDEEALTLADKSGKTYCFGHLSGAFPAMPCDPVGNEDSETWGSLKGMYR